jgi:hypothetical protein
MGPPPEGSPEGRRGGGERFLAPGFFRALDADKDGNVNRTSSLKLLKNGSTSGTPKKPALGRAKLREGLNAALPRPQFAAPGGRRGMGGGRGGEKPTEIHQFALLCLDRDTGKILWQQTQRRKCHMNLIGKMRAVLLLLQVLPTVRMSSATSVRAAFTVST